VIVWNTLTVNERAALRKLALGHIYDVPGRMRARLAELGLVDSGPHSRPTDAGLALLREHPNRRKPGLKAC
jgi:hypothetical protein